MARRARLRAFALLFFVCVALSTPGNAQFQLLPPPPPPPPPQLLLDPILQSRLFTPGRSRVIIRARSVSLVNSLLPLIQSVGGIPGRTLMLLEAVAADVPNAALGLLGASPLVRRVALDRVTLGQMQRTTAITGVDAVRQSFGYDGAGIGVAVVDSGITPWHDDLGDPAVPGAQRVAQFVDFVDGESGPYDDYGHGTHVAGIIAGNGFDSGGARQGMAPGAHLVALKVLDGSGTGRISHVIAALELRHRAQAGAQHPRRQPVDRGAGRRVVHGRSPCGGDPSRRRSGHRRRRVGRQQRAGGGRPHHLRVDHGARQCAVGPDRRGGEPHGHARSQRRHHGGVQLARPDGHRPRGETRSGGARRRHRLAQRSRQRDVHVAIGLPPRRHGGDQLSAVPEPERHEPGRPGRGGCGCADAAGEPRAHAERGEGDPPVQRRGLRRRRVLRGRRLSQRRGRDRSGARYSRTRPTPPSPGLRAAVRFTGATSASPVDGSSRT